MYQERFGNEDENWGIWRDCGKQPQIHKKQASRVLWKFTERKYKQQAEQITNERSGVKRDNLGSIFWKLHMASTSPCLSRTRAVPCRFPTKSLRSTLGRLTPILTEFSSTRHRRPHSTRWTNYTIWYLIYRPSRDQITAPYTNRTGTLQNEPRQNGRHFVDDTFKRIFFNENMRISIEISLQFALKGPIDNITSLVHIMAWRQSGKKPLSEPMMVRWLTHICITRPQWVNGLPPTDLFNWLLLDTCLCIIPKWIIILNYLSFSVA